MYPCVEGLKRTLRRRLVGYYGRVAERHLLSIICFNVYLHGTWHVGLFPAFFVIPG